MTKVFGLEVQIPPGLVRSTAPFLVQEKDPPRAFFHLLLLGSALAAVCSLQASH